MFTFEIEVCCDPAVTSLSSSSHTLQLHRRILVGRDGRWEGSASLPCEPSSSLRFPQSWASTGSGHILVDHSRTGQHVLQVPRSLWCSAYCRNCPSADTVVCMLAKTGSVLLVELDVSWAAAGNGQLWSTFSDALGPLDHCQGSE